MEQRKFLAMVGPLAQADMQKSGILASLTIAQAILESGWGTSELATKANALFGIKADARWSGRVYSKDTKECYDGVTYTTITALFRAYDSWAESVADHSAFLLANKRYAAVVGERDYKVACKAMPIMDGYTATRRIRELENPALAGIPILAMTANAFDEDRRNALECGMNGFLSKPIVIADLVQEMRKVL